jgi:uncharacterized protein
MTMTTHRLAVPLFILIGALLASLAHAQNPRQLSWEDLVPKTAGPEDPFAKLTREQLTDLALVASIRDRQARSDKVSAADAADEQSLSKKLKQAGVNVDDLLARRKEIAAQRQKVSSGVNPTLNGKLVRIPGYLLPLEYSGKMVSEFLLVPWVGACIHTPPPPPNQIVHVKPDKPFETNGMFAAVWVTGTLATTSSKKSLFMLDGSSDIDIGYSLRASVVEPYKE